MLAQQLGEAAERTLDQRPHALPQRAEWSRPGEREQVRNPEIETIDLLDDGLQLLARGGGGGLDPALGKLGGRAQTRQRVPEPVGHGGRHLPDRGQLLGLDQLRAGLAQLLRHPGEGPRKLADFVA